MRGTLVMGPKNAPEISWTTSESVEWHEVISLFASTCGRYGMTPAIEPRLTVAEVAALTHRSEDYIRSEMREGRLKSYLPHGRKRGRLVRMDWLREWEEKASDRH